MYNSGLLLSVIETGTITYDVYIYDYDFKICFQRSNLQQHPVPRGLVPRAGAHRARQLSVRGPRPAACQEPQWSIEPDPGQQLTGSGPRPRLWPQGHRHPGGLVDGGRHPAHHLHRGHPGYVPRDTWHVTRDSNFVCVQATLHLSWFWPTRTLTWSQALSTFSFVWWVRK